MLSVAVPAALPSASQLPYVLSDFTQAVSLQKPSCTKDTDRCYLFDINNCTYWICVQTITILLMLIYKQYIWNSMEHTQKWHKQNHMNLYKYVPITCKHCKYYIFLWWWQGIIWEFSAVQLSEARKTWPHFETLIEFWMYFMWQPCPQPAICYFFLKHKQTEFSFCLQDSGTGDNSCIEEILRVGILKKKKHLSSSAILFTLKREENNKNIAITAVKYITL